MHDRATSGIGLGAFEGGTSGGPLLLMEHDTWRSASLMIAPVDHPLALASSLRSSCKRFSPGTRNCTLQYNTDYYGNDLISYQNVSGVAACCSLCQANAACNCFSHANETDPAYEGTCWLKTSTAGATKSVHTSGTVCSPGWEDIALAWGVQGYVTSVPAGFGYSILLAGEASGGGGGGPGNTLGGGPVAAAHAFGRVTRRYNNLTRLAPKNDTMATHLSYWTDNGSTQYGGTKPLPHTEIFAQIFGNLTQQGVFPQMLQLDPWWYPTGDDNDPGCSQLWDTRPGLFPTGLSGLRNSIGGAELLLYMAFWCTNTTDVPDYQKQGFIFEDSLYYNAGFDKGTIAAISPEDSLRFHKYIFEEKTRAGELQGHELDFTDFNLLVFPSHLFTVGGTEQWMRGMFQAAADYGLPSQVRHATSEPIHSDSKAVHELTMWPRTGSSPPPGHALALPLPPI